MKEANVLGLPTILHIIFLRVASGNVNWPICPLSYLIWLLSCLLYTSIVRNGFALFLSYSIKGIFEKSFRLESVYPFEDRVVRGYVFWIHKEAYLEIQIILGSLHNQTPFHLSLIHIFCLLNPGFYIFLDQYLHSRDIWLSVRLTSSHFYDKMRQNSLTPVHYY